MLGLTSFFAVNGVNSNGILTEFLRMNRAEVIAMSIFEYDKEEKKLRKAEFESGVAEGEIKAKKEAAIEMAKTGMSEVQIASILKIEKTVICQWLTEERNVCSEMD